MARIAQHGSAFELKGFKGLWRLADGMFKIRSLDYKTDCSYCTFFFFFQSETDNYMKTFPIWNFAGRVAREKIATMHQIF